MKLYLVQHGDALAKAVDPERPLSAKGQAEVEKVAAFLDQAGVRPRAILHSGKKRAEQTAKRLALAVGAAVRFEAIAGIDPLDATEALAGTVGGWTEETLIVGHQPFMGRLVSRLVAGSEDVSMVAFQTGSVVCLERRDDTGWAIAWMIRPELV